MRVRTGLFATLRGAEIESSYIIGDFAVRAEASDKGSLAGCTRLTGTPRIVAEKEFSDGRLVHSGYPFYSGRMILRTQHTGAGARRAGRPASAGSASHGGACAS